MKVINKVLAGHEDIAIGQGVVAQQREGNITNVTQVELNWILRSTTEIRALDITKYTRVQLHQAGPTLEYWYDPTSNATDDGYSVLEPASLPTVGRWLLVVSSSESDVFIPLAGTQPGAPITGPLDFQNSLGANIFRLQTDVFGAGIMGFVADTEGTFTIAPKNDGGALEAFNFGVNGTFSIPSPSSTNSWSFQAVTENGDVDTLLIAPVNAIGGYGNHDAIIQPGVGVKFLISKDGYMEAPRNTDPGDPDNAFTTKAFVESILPPGGGEANTASSPGASGVDLVLPKVSVDLQFKKLIAGTDITLDEGADAITINGSGGGGGGLPAGSINQTLRNTAGTNEYEATPGLLIDAAGNVSAGPGAIAPTHAMTINGDSVHRSGGSALFNNAGDSNFGLIFNDNGRLHVSAPAGGGLDLLALANGTAFTLSSTAHVAMSIEYNGNTTTVLNYNGNKRIKTQPSGVEITGGMTVRNAADSATIIDISDAESIFYHPVGVWGNLSAADLVSTSGNITSAAQVIISSAAPSNASHATRKDYVDGQINTHVHADYMTTNTSQTVSGTKTFSGKQFYTGQTGNPFDVYEIANVQYVNDVNASDARKKTNAVPLWAGLNELMRLNPVSFTWTKGHWEGHGDYGLIAQEVENVLPDAVRTGEDDMKMLNPLAMIGVLVKSVQELAAEVEELRNAQNS